MAIDLLCSKLGNLVKFLPTGTVFIFQFLSPVLTNYGSCNKLNKNLSAILIALCGFSCCFSCFTDSYKGSDGKTHYGIATFKGLWPSTNADESVNLSSYKLRFGDFVHAFFASVVFCVLVLFEPNTVECFYPSFAASGGRVLAFLVILPPVTLVVSLAFMCFPNNRHGIGYPSTEGSSNKTGLLLP